ncbi:inositol monophosphatase family protein [Thioalkalivibrio sp. XN8]|uniref:inositol monophosphatase family protein n=1 Tax=Thioalkalivibrio sp. XN8 TaxID=2712863 RepID=UPI0013EB4D52|nr:inositol monophosphatase family protein [Thioalkalivibrio sp. XN8]NGP53908.1 inositol monophosphatase [Thioalkalivibrio sp. XN8]
MHPLLNIGVRAARRAGDLIVRHINQLDAIKVDTKGRNDFVSEVDRMAEDDIIQTVRRSYPDHAFLAEESGASGDAEFVWIIDPLDGTTNFLHGFPVFAVSIAVMQRGRLEHGVIYDPMRQELFTCSRGAGATVDGRKMRVSDTRNLAAALIGTGFPYKDDPESLGPYMAMLKDVICQTAGARRPGAAALDLAYVAAGRLDGFWEIGLNIWDIAAGALMIQECGGIVTDLGGRDGWQQSGNIVAGNPRIHDALLKLIEPHLTAGLRR